jgi:5,10-methenyltetrahydrofolate synthetase
MTFPPNLSASDPQPQARKALRAQMLTRREALPHAWRLEASGQIATHLTAWLARHAPHARTIAIYHPHRAEVDLLAWAQGRAEQFALPVVSAPGSPLLFAAWKPGEPTVPGAYGIAVPELVQPVQPDVLVIPCVAFNAQRFRLGYGGGYYDRTLGVLQPRPRTLGVAFANQQVEFAPAAHDIALDAVITELGVV